MTMDTHLEETERRRNATALSVWENEGGAPGQNSTQHQYGRRIEADRSWTIYHVFTGIPARFRGDAMTGLSRMDASSGMLRLNLRNAERRVNASSSRPSRQSRNQRSSDYDAGR